jgi:hypothetical protein
MYGKPAIHFKSRDNIWFTLGKNYIAKLTNLDLPELQVGKKKILGV